MAGWSQGKQANLQWDEDAARRIVSRVVERKLGIFAAFPDIDRDDLLSIGLEGARAAWPRFNPKKGLATTFIYRVAWCDIRDTYRARTRSGRSEAKAALEATLASGISGAAPRVREDLSDVGDERDLATWLLHVYMGAKQRYRSKLGSGKLRRRGWHWLNPARAIAITVLMGRLGIDARGVHALLAARPELWRAMRLLHCPSQQWVEEIVAHAPAKYRNFQRLRERYEKKVANKVGGGI